MILLSNIYPIVRKYRSCACTRLKSIVTACKIKYIDYIFEFFKVCFGYFPLNDAINKENNAKTIQNSFGIVIYVDQDD